MNKVENIISVINYIEEHLSEKLTLSSIAKSVGYSKYHLHRIFSDTVGLSIHDYVQRRQLTEAAKLLVFSDRPILEIALISGYESQQAFTNIFRQMYKKSPNEYRSDEEFYPLQLKFDLKAGSPQNHTMMDAKENISFATAEDIPVWIDLVHLVVDGFPHLNESEYLMTLKEYIRKKQALILKSEGIAVAVMTISHNTGSIDFFGVHPLYRNSNIARLFLDKLMNEFLADRSISITTFREGDKADTGYRDAYLNLGFAEAELLTEFGYPTQRLILAKEAGGNTDDAP